jgi:fatty acid desaturase
MPERPGMFRTRREAAGWFLIVLASAMLMIAAVATVIVFVGIVPFVVVGIVLVTLAVSVGLARS